MMMNTKFGLFAIVGILMACSTTQTAGQRDAQRRNRLAQLADSLENRTLTLRFDYVTPRRTGGHYLTSEYSVRIQGDTLTSFLPYFGVAYRSDLNNQYNSPLDFKGRINTFDYTKAKGDRYRVTIGTKNNLDQLVYRFEIFDNGKATLDVSATDRESISFSGQIEEEERP